MSRQVGVVLLAVWLILTGLIMALGLTFTAITIIMGLVAIAAGVLLLVGR